MKTIAEIKAEVESECQTTMSTGSPEYRPAHNSLNQPTKDYKPLNEFTDDELANLKQMIVDIQINRGEK